MKRILSIFISFVLIFAGFTVFAEINYNDIEDCWAEDVILKWSGLGVINGYNGKFYPDNYITRGEFAVILNRIFKLECDTENIFSDLKETFYTKDILALNKADIILGYDGKIRPDDYLTREEASVI